MRSSSIHKVTYKAALDLGICISILGLGSSWACAASTVAIADYARAERFLPWNASRYVVNGDIQHHWIGNEDRFWYLRTEPTGEKKFVVVDAASGEQSPAFDQKAIADALSKLTDNVVEAGKLPFSIFRYIQGNSAIQFEYAKKLWTCQLQSSTCVMSAPTEAANQALSPDGKWAAFVRDHNLWVRSTSGDEEFALTRNGIEHYEYAGTPGDSTDTITKMRHPGPTPPQVIWSPDSRYILSHQLDERKVKDLYLIQSVPEDGSVRPKLYTYRYDMPGDENVPELEPVVFNVGTRQEVRLATRSLIGAYGSLITRHLTWWSADSKKIYYLNKDRFSKTLALDTADPASGHVTEILRESSKTYVQPCNGNPFGDAPSIRVLLNGDVIWYSERDGWGHLYYYDGTKGTLRNQITHGNWVVRSIVRVDVTEKRVYFMANGREGGDPYEQRLYSTQFDGSGMRLLTPEDADHELPPVTNESISNDSLLSEAELDRFSPSGRYFVDSYSRPDLVPMLVLRACDGRLIRRLEQADITKLKEGGYIPIEPFQVLAADGKTAIYGNLFRPSTFDPGRKYPVIDAIYPGPQTIRTEKGFIGATFDDLEAQSLAELGFIVITIDGRGTPNRSKAFLDYSYGRMDKASDLEDHIAGIRQLAQRYPYMDLDRVGLDGASGGGYAAVHALEAYPDFYKVAVSASGNYDQRGYLSVWGETYNGPEEGSGSPSGSDLLLAANLEGKLLLMHGEMDDNVSPTLTMKLVDALIRANKDFDLLIIPNANHDAYTMSPYFIRRKWDYFVRNLLEAQPPVNYSIVRPE